MAARRKARATPEPRRVPSRTGRRPLGDDLVAEWALSQVEDRHLRSLIREDPKRLACLIDAQWEARPHTLRDVASQMRAGVLGLLESAGARVLARGGGSQRPGKLDPGWIYDLPGGGKLHVPDRIERDSQYLDDVMTGVIATLRALAEVETWSDRGEQGLAGKALGRAALCLEHGWNRSLERWAEKAKTACARLRKGQRMATDRKREKREPILAAIRRAREHLGIQRAPKGGWPRGTSGLIRNDIVVRQGGRLPPGGLDERTIRRHLDMLFPPR